MKKDLQPIISAFIASYRSSHLYSPTIREIADGTGIPRATVGRTVSRMRSAGLLDYSGHRKILPAEKEPSSSGSISVPVYLTSEAWIRSAPDCTAVLPTVLTGEGPCLVLPAPEAFPMFGIEAGDPLLVRTEMNPLPGQLLLNWNPEAGEIHLLLSEADSSEGMPSRIGVAARVLKPLLPKPDR